VLLPSCVGRASLPEASRHLEREGRRLVEEGVGRCALLPVDRPRLPHAEGGHLRHIRRQEVPVHLGRLHPRAHPQGSVQSAAAVGSALRGTGGVIWIERDERRELRAAQQSSRQAGCGLDTAAAASSAASHLPPSPHLAARIASSPGQRAPSTLSTLQLQLRRTRRVCEKLSWGRRPRLRCRICWTFMLESDRTELLRLRRGNRSTPKFASDALPCSQIVASLVRCRSHAQDEAHHRHPPRLPPLHPQVPGPYRTRVGSHAKDSTYSVEHCTLSHVLWNIVAPLLTFPESVVSLFAAL
jgi:hypothetical protein